MHRAAQAFEAPNPAIPLSAIPPRQPQPMPVQDLRMWTPSRLLAAAAMGLFAAGRATVMAMVPMKRDA